MNEPLAKVAIGLAILCVSSACGGSGQGAQTVEELQDETFRKQQYAETTHKARTAKANVAGKVYHDKKFLKKQCPDDVGKPVSARSKACLDKLESIFFARLRLNYQFTNWQEVATKCQSDPEECSTPEGVEKVVYASNWDGSRRATNAVQNNLEQQLSDDIEFGDADCRYEYSSEGINEDGKATVPTTEEDPTRVVTTKAAPSSKCRTTPRKKPD